MVQSQPQILSFLGYTHTKPKFLVLMANNSLDRKIARVEYKGIYRRLMQVFAVGRCESSAGLIVTDGIGWNPSSEAGKAGEPVQKYTCEQGKMVLSTLLSKEIIKEI